MANCLYSSIPVLGMVQADIQNKEAVVREKVIQSLMHKWELMVVEVPGEVNQTVLLVYVLQL